MKPKMGSQPMCIGLDEQGELQWVIETFYVTASGVTIICHGKDSVMEWVSWIIDHGMAPTVERKAA